MATDSSWKSAFDRFRHSNRLAVFIVYSTLMVDNMLLTCVVPILPVFFFEEKVSLSSNAYQLTTVGSLETTTPIAETTNTTDDTIVMCEESRQQKYLEQENLFLAFLLASKPLVQAIANAGVGPLADRVGYDVPMFVGYIVLIASSIIFAFGETYAVLFIARAVQGIGSACASTSGLAMLANRYRDDEERGKMLGVALGGLAMGVLVGPTFASVTYQFAGKRAPFLILGGAAFIIAVLQLCSRQLQVVYTARRDMHSSMTKLLRDPYIVLAASAVVLGNMVIGVLETGQPIWMMMTMCAEKWMLGAATLPVSLSYLIVIIVVPRIIKSKRRWITCFISYYIAIVGNILMPFCTNFYQIIGPGLLIGTAVGMVDATMFPILGYLTDTRHAPIYGSVYAIADAAFCIAFIIGPLLAGAVIRVIGFKWLMFIVAMINFTFAPFVCFLRDPPPASEESRAIIDQEYTGDYNSVSFNADISSVGRSVDKGEDAEHTK